MGYVFEELSEKFVSVRENRKKYYPVGMFKCTYY